MPTIEKYKKQEDRKKQAYQHFINKGYSPEASAGIVGNLLYESGLDTSAEGDKGFQGGSSFGIAQFRGERLKRLKSRYGDNWTDFNNQLEFVDWELNNTHKKAGDLLKKADDVHVAGQVFSDLYEIPAKKYKQNKDRASKVEQVYQTLVVTPQNTPTQEAIVNQDYVPQTQSTTTVTNLPTSTENVNFTAEINKLEQQAKDKELAFLQEYRNTFTTPEEYIQQEQDLVQVPRANLTDIFNQVSQFVDTPIMAQQGGMQLSENEIAFLSEINKNKIEVKPSKIEGNGVFVKGVFEKGDVIGLAHSNGQPSTELGRMHNHSEKPNAESIKIGEERFLKALKKLKKGEEITVDYRKQPELEQPSSFKK